MQFLPILTVLIPLLGKLLLMIPVVPNRAIPAILGAFNIAHKYWLMLGFPTAVAAIAGETHLAFVVPGAAISLIWGCIDQYLWHSWYHKQKAEAALKGETSWWAKNSADLWKKS